MFDRILIPLDGSEESESICGYVLDLAKSVGSEVGLLKVLGPTGSMYPLEDREIEEAWRYLFECAQVFKKSDVQTLLKVTAGNPAEEILAQSRSLGADLIAMATHRKSALSRSVLGSVTDRVLRTTRVPLLTIKPRRLSDPPGRSRFPNVVIVPLDGSELGETAVPVASHLAKTTKAKVLFVRVVSPSGNGGIDLAAEYLSAFVQRARGDAIEAAGRTVVGRPATRIVDVAAEHRGALLVMSTHGASGFRRWTVGSVTERVIRSSGQPVLALTPNTKMGELAYDSEQETSLIGSH